MNASDYTKTRQVDKFGNISYAVTDRNGQPVATIERGGGSKWQVTLPSGSCAPVGSVKAGVEWLAWADSLKAGCANIVENAEALDKIAAVFQRPGFWDEVADGADFREIADIVLLTGRNVGPYPAGN